MTITVEVQVALAADTVRQLRATARARGVTEATLIEQALDLLFEHAVSTVEHQVSGTTLDEAERVKRINEVTQNVLQRRQAVYRELAKGVDEG